MMKINMTDNLYEFRKFIFKNLVKEGYKFIARDKDGTIYAFSRKPIRQGRVWSFDRAFGDGNKLKDISIVSALFSNIKWEDEKPFEITYTNWDSVPIDTNVVVTGLDGSEWKCHFFKKVNDNSILVFRDGKTSWTTDDVVEVDINNVRFA